MVDLNHLNEVQKEAVMLTDGPIMILAGAGSGKTRTLVTRMAYLLDNLNISPYQILALTFSNKAAKEMRDRIAYEGKIHGRALQVLTFHSFCANLLRSEYTYLGLGRNFTIYDKGESKSIVKALLAQRGISQKEIPPLSILYFIDELKNMGFYPGRKKELQGVEAYYENHEFFSYFKEYESELHRSNAVDFGGLITGVLQLFESYPEVLARYQARYKYILVDEYQDTNRAQFDLVLKLCEKHKNICVVGDEDQSIYSWRGADIRNILEFDKIFPESKLIKLEQNYRSSKKIIEAASCVIARNVARSGKSMWTKNSEGDDIEIVECPSDRMEAEFIVNQIKKLAKKNVDYKDMAAFYRNNSQSRVLEECLRRENIPYRVVGGIKFYERKEIKDILAYLRLVVNIKDSLSLSRVINVPPRGVGVATLRKLEGEAIRMNLSLWEVIEGIVRNLEAYNHLKITGKIKSALSEFVFLVDELILMNQNKEVPSAIYEKLLKNSGYLELLKASKDYESASRIDNLEELRNAIKQYEQSTSIPSIVGYLENITLNIHDDEDIFQEKGELSLMTVHGSKGLEFPYVFLIGIEENIFPSYKSLESSDLSLEEERRLFYVAMTRAMKKLFLSFSQARMLHGNLVFNGPSRFIYEIPDKYYVWKKMDRETSYSEGRMEDGAISRSSRSRSKSATYPKGSKIIHSLYGEGLVLDTDGLGNEEKVLVAFNGGLKKKFMVKYAPITVVEEY